MLYWMSSEKVLPVSLDIQETISRSLSHNIGRFMKGEQSDHY
jgi:hypothetical protein